MSSIRSNDPIALANVLLSEDVCGQGMQIFPSNDNIDQIFPGVHFL